MKKSTKGALAAAAAGFLLLGGAGTLAYWSDDQDVPGGDIVSGRLELSAPDCGTGWTLDDGEDPAGAPFGVGSKLVPGDVLTKVCTFGITAQGDHLRATLDVTDADFSSANAFTDELAVDADFQIDGAAAPAEITEDNDGDTLTATITVTFDGPAATNASQNQTAVLDAITVTAQQVHD